MVNLNFRLFCFFFSPWGGLWSFWAGWARWQDFPATQRSNTGDPVCPSHPPAAPGRAWPAGATGLERAACDHGHVSPLYSGHWSDPLPCRGSPGWCGLSGTELRSAPSWPRCTAESAGSCGSPCCAGVDVCNENKGQLCQIVGAGAMIMNNIGALTKRTFPTECEPSSQRRRHNAGWGWPRPTAGSCCSPEGQSTPTPAAPAGRKLNTDHWGNFVWSLIAHTQDFEAYSSENF